MPVESVDHIWSRMAFGEKRDRIAEAVRALKKAGLWKRSPPEAQARMARERAKMTLAEEIERGGHGTSS